jgi:hypothetical protein
MQIYKQEIADGLGQALANIKPVSIACKAQMLESEEILSKKLMEKVLAAKSIPQSSDKQLLYTKSLMVSTNWNSNDDIFFRDYAWAARKTPLYKPNNIDHIEDRIVGSIIDTWVIDNDGNVLADDTKVEDLPDLFHICNADVIYTHWQSQEKVEEVGRLVAEIKEGSKYVSMECLFPAFDYGILAPDNSFYIVARSEETSFLTKHLRSFGGVGEYEGHRVGRVLKDFNFSGKGYTSTPANPNSIIFGFSEPKTDIVFASVSKENPFSSNNSVLISCSWNNSKAKENTDTKSSENKMSAELLTSLQAELAQVKAELKTAQEKIASANAENLQAKINELNEKLEAAYKVGEDEKKKAKEKEDKSKADELELNAVKAELVVKANELNELKLQVSKSNRVSILVSGGFSKEDAEAKLVTFASLNDEQFSVLAKELVEANKVKISVASKTQEVPTETQTTASELQVEGTETVVNLSSASDTTQELEAFQTAIASLSEPQARTSFKNKK